MLSFLGNGVNDVYAQVIADVMYNGKVVPSRNGATRELSPVAIELHKPRERLVTSTGRPVNVAFALAEVLWILQGREDVEMLQFYNSTIGNYSDNGKTFNAPYGRRLRKDFGHDQIEDVVRTLKEDPETRQATLVISHPGMDRGWDLVPDLELDEYVKHKTKDRACNVLAHLLIREGKLNWMQVVRSNDAIWGTPYNWMQFTHLQEWIATQVGVEVGKYTHFVDSLHVYEHHWEEAKYIVPFNLYKTIGAEHEPMEQATNDILQTVAITEEWYRSSVRTTMQFPADLPGYWRDVVMVLAAHSFYKSKQDTKTIDILVAGDPVYAAAQLSFYWQHRWSKLQFPKEIRGRIFDNFDDKVANWITGNTE